MKYNLAGFEFATKTALKAEVQRILHSYPSSPPDNILKGNDSTLIIALVGLHPNADEKIGVGIDYIFVLIIEYGTPGFMIRRVDGSITDFSYLKCLRGKELSHRSQVLEAMRKAIRNQTSEFRRREFSNRQSIFCPLTNVQLINDPTTHVDHYEPSFIELAEKYAQEANGFDGIPVISDRVRPGPRLTSPHLERFQSFHKEIAQLRLIHGSANLMRERKPTKTNSYRCPGCETFHDSNPCFPGCGELKG